MNIHARLRKFLSKLARLFGCSNVPYSTWIDDIPDGGIKTKNKTNNSDSELNDTLYSTVTPSDQWRRYDSASLSN